MKTEKDRASHSGKAKHKPTQQLIDTYASCPRMILDIRDHGIFFKPLSLIPPLHNAKSESRGYPTASSGPEAFPPNISSSASTFRYSVSKPKLHDAAGLRTCFFAFAQKGHYKCNASPPNR